MPGSEAPQWTGFWKWVELTALAAGMIFSPIVSLWYDSWHCNEEIVALMAFIETPYLFFAICSFIARKRVHSRILYMIIALLAILMTSGSLLLYMRAVLHIGLSYEMGPGIVFILLPMLLLFYLPVIFVIIITGFVVARHCCRLACHIGIIQRKNDRNPE